MPTSTRPHQKIHSAALEYIRQHAAQEPEWRYTVLGTLPERMQRVVQLQDDELVIVACFIDAQRWYVMSTGRVFGVFRGSTIDSPPLEIRQWRWGNFKHGGRAEAEVATLALADGSHLKLAYETGPAAMAPIYYQHFWTTKWPALEPLG